jgi:ubiquinone/menaquinone biosynthesis C-methylase UbiE
LSWDPVWETVFSNQEWGKYPSEDLIRFVARNFYKAPNRKEVKILEVGCGPGANLWYMAREGFTVYGIDGSKTAIQRANDRLNKECPGWNGTLVVGDITQLPFQDGFFDAVIDLEAISCNSYEAAKQIYSEMARVTKPKGKMFSRTFATGSWGDQTGENVGYNAWIVSEGPLLGKGYTRFTALHDIEDLITGFVVTEIELISKTANGRQHEIKEWVIIGEKI